MNRGIPADVLAARLAHTLQSALYAEDVEDSRLHLTQAKLLLDQLRDSIAAGR